MKLHKIKLFRLMLMLIVALTMTSCENIFQEIFFSEQCKKCEVVNESSYKVYATEQGCGGSNVDIEENAKVTAYNLNSGYRYTKYVVRCETWEEDREE